MKLKICLMMATAVSFSLAAHSQDSTKKIMKPKMKADTGRMNKKNYKRMHDTAKIYRDTRLGSSEKKYDTYKKNENGAGAVTTSPKKERP